MFNFSASDGGLIVGIAVLVIAGAFMLRRYLTRTTPISSVHAGKKGHGKFDRALVRARQNRLVGPPPIDTSNLPAPNPHVVTAMQAITVADIERELDELTGEVDTTVGGKTVRITSRNSFHQHLETAMQKLEEEYKALGVSTRRTKYVKRGRTMYNLEATIPGIDPTKVIIVGSHLDCTAGDTGRAEDPTYGADDDGSGTRGAFRVCKGIVEIMKAKGAKPAVTLRFLHFTGEEQGLWGSYTYSDACAQAKEDILGVYQMDMIAWCAKPGNRSHSLVVKLARNVARYKLNLTVNDTHDHAVQNRSDQAGFLDHGWKAVLISEEFSDDGFNPYYHSRKDRRKNCNIPYMVENIRMVLATVADDAAL